MRLGRNRMQTEIITWGRVGRKSRFLALDFAQGRMTTAGKKGILLVMVQFWLRIRPVQREILRYC